MSRYRLGSSLPMGLLGLLAGWVLRNLQFQCHESGLAGHHVIPAREAVLSYPVAMISSSSKRQIMLSTAETTLHPQSMKSIH